MANEHSLTRPIPRSNLREEILRQLRVAIVTGEFEPGALLNTGEIARDLGASRTPVREALLELERMGLVEILPSVGFRITVPTSDEFQDMLQVRELLEVPALAMVAGKMSDDALEIAKDLLARLAAAAEDRDLARFIELDRQYHVHLVAQSGNSRLTSIVDELRAIQRVPGLAEVVDEGGLAARNAEHQALLESLRAGDRKEAQRLARTHIAFSRERSISNSLRA